MPELTRGQLLDWVAYENIEGPIGGPRLDYYMEKLLAVLGVESHQMPWADPSEVIDLSDGANDDDDDDDSDY